MLKDMIQNARADGFRDTWPEEDGCLATSDKAFDMIAGENIGISKHILCGMLSRVQRRAFAQETSGKNCI